MWRRATLAYEIKLRVDEVRSGKIQKIQTIRGEEVLRELGKEFPDEY